MVPKLSSATYYQQDLGKSINLFEPLFLLTKME